MVLLDQQ